MELRCLRVLWEMLLLLGRDEPMLMKMNSKIRLISATIYTTFVVVCGFLILTRMLFKMPCWCSNTNEAVEQAENTG